MKTNETPDQKLIKMASSYRAFLGGGYKATCARRLIQGRAFALINKTYTVRENREAVSQEWNKLANAKGGAL